MVAHAGGARHSGSPELFAQGGLDYWRASGASHHRELVGGLRFRPAASGFVDASFGPHVLSRTRLADRRFGVALQFASRLAAGLAVGEGQRHEVAAYVEHLSNASIAQPNFGMTFFGVEYRYHAR